MACFFVRYVKSEDVFSILTGIFYVASPKSFIHNLIIDQKKPVERVVELITVLA